MNHRSTVIHKSANLCLSSNHQNFLNSKNNGVGFINFSRKSAECSYRNKIDPQSIFKLEDAAKKQFLGKGGTMKPSKLKKHNISTAEFWDKKKKKREILVALMLKYLTFNLKRKKNKQKFGDCFASSIGNLQNQFFTAQKIYYKKIKCQEQPNEMGENPLSNLKQNKHTQFIEQRIFNKKLISFQRKLCLNQIEKPQNLSLEVKNTKHFGQYLDESSLNPWQNYPLECKQIQMKRESLNFLND